VKNSGVFRAVEKRFSANASRLEVFLASCQGVNCISSYQSRSAQHPSCPAPAPRPSACAKARRPWGEWVCRRTHPLRRLTRRGCLSGAACRAASSAAPPQGRAPQLPRCAASGSQAAGPPFFWVLFFGRAKKRTCAAGRTSRPTAPRAPASADQKAQCPTGNQAPSQTQRLEAFSASSPVSTRATRYHFRYRCRKQAAIRGRDLSPPKPPTASPPAPTA
jgi:hypothetical protein